MEEPPIKLIIWVLVIAGALLKPIIERRRKRQAALREQKLRETAPAEPAASQAPEEEAGPQLPYEDLVNEVFGPYIARRRQEARRPSAPRPAPASPPPPPVRVTRIESVAIAAPEPTRAVASAAASPAPRPAAPAVAGPPLPHRTLEERLFGNRSLSPAARLVLSAEILQRPRMFRKSGGSWRR